MRANRILALLLSTTAVSCTTSIALVDDTFGHERVHAGRFAHVRTARAPLDLAIAGRLRFTLDVAITNDRDEAWVLPAAAFTLRADGNGDACAPRLDLPPGAILATVPARSDLDVRLPVLLTLAEGMTVYDIERVPIALTLSESGTEILHRRVVVGCYSQTGQIIRVVALTTGGLLLLSLF